MGVADKIPDVKEHFSWSLFAHWWICHWHWWVLSVMMSYQYINQWSVIISYQYINPLYNNSRDGWAKCSHLRFFSQVLFHTQVDVPPTSPVYKILVLFPLEVPSAFKTEDCLLTCWKQSWRTLVIHKDSSLSYLFNWRWQNSKVQTKPKNLGNCMKLLYSIQITARDLDWSQSPHLLRSVP